MIRHPGAAAVVPLLDPPDTADPRVLLIRQFRHAADDYIWEVPAGRLDPGESPEVCAHRELAEETGMRAARMEPLTMIYTTPGFTDERIHLFLAQDLREEAHAREHDEVIAEIARPPLREALGMIRRGEIVDSKTICGLHLAGAALGVIP
jgi:ADP-ribose pyrophosphatase